MTRHFWIKWHNIFRFPKTCITSFTTEFWLSYSRPPKLTSLWDCAYHSRSLRILVFANSLVIADNRVKTGLTYIWLSIKDGIITSALDLGHIKHFQLLFLLLLLCGADNWSITHLINASCLEPLCCRFGLIDMRVTLLIAIIEVGEPLSELQRTILGQIDLIHTSISFHHGRIAGLSQLSQSHSLF